MNAALRIHQRQSGISYIEVLVATALILLTLLPMMNAMRGSTTSATSHEAAAARNANLLARMEEVLAEPYSALQAAAIAAESSGKSYDRASSYSDPDGAADRRIVYLSNFDGDNADADDKPYTGVEADIMWVRVQIEGTMLFVDSLVYR